MLNLSPDEPLTNVGCHGPAAERADTGFVRTY